MLHNVNMSTLGMSEDTHPSVKRILSFPRIQQRSPEWFSYRCKRVTASEVSTVLAQGKGAMSLMDRKKSGGSPSFSTEYTRIGTENEDKVVDKYREKYPGVIVYHDLSIIPLAEHDFVAASLDACTDTGINVEIKTCFKDKFVKVSKAYYDQVQLQMEVANLDHTHLVQQYIRMEGQPVVVHDIPRDREWFRKNAPILKKFVEDLEEYFPFDLVLINYQIQRYESSSDKCVSFDIQRIKEGIWRMEDFEGFSCSDIFQDIDDMEVVSENFKIIKWDQ